MKIRFIGTGSGRISPDRFHSSILISVSEYNLLVDTGDSVSRALISQNIPFNSINGILISHLHPDHFGGFTSLIVQMQMTDRKEPLYVFVHQTLINKIKDFLTLSYIFMERMKFPMHFVGFDFDNEIKVVPELTFVSKKNTHLSEYKKYNPTLSFACGSFLFSSNGKNVYYSGDIGSPDDLFLFKEDKIDIFITEAAHVSADSILMMSEKLRPGKVILTHMSDEDIEEIQMRLVKAADDSMLMAQDGLFLSV